MLRLDEDGRPISDGPRFETTESTVWHQPPANWFTIPAGTECSEVDVAEIVDLVERHAFQRAIMAARDSGTAPRLVLLKGRLRLLDDKVLKAVE